VAPDGTKTTLAEVPGGPNGLALGPDGALYLCNNGGCFTPLEVSGSRARPVRPRPLHRRPHPAVDPPSGAVTDLYTECDGLPLRAPNDLCSTATAASGSPTTASATSAAATGRALLRPRRRLVDRGGGVPGRRAQRHRLSPDGGTVYWAETHNGRVPADCRGAGRAGAGRPFRPDRLLGGLPGFQRLDSLAVTVPATSAWPRSATEGSLSLAGRRGHRVRATATRSPPTSALAGRPHDRAHHPLGHRQVWC
jgi:gluconolactonase